jgi:hypothetical protein
LFKVPPLAGVPQVVLIRIKPETDFDRGKLFDLYDFLNVVIEFTTIE